MSLCNKKVLLSVFVLFFNNLTFVHGLNCFQCSGTDSTHPFQCNEFLDDTDLEPKSCDVVYGAKYCIKHVGRFEVCAIRCYQCTSDNTIHCGDGMIHMGGLQPQNCDHVFEAQYCIKMAGGIGTKRYCSPLDLGNYCDYVKQPGDKLEYRSCVYTCIGDGCNSAMSKKPNLTWFFIITSSILIYFKQFFR